MNNADKLTRKMGRPQTEEYRKNLIRVAAVENLLINIIDRVSEQAKDSRAHQIIVDELEMFLNRECEKVKNRSARRAEDKKARRGKEPVTRQGRNKVEHGLPLT